MKLFVYEHITSGAFAEQELPKSLALEGTEMLSAVLTDCHELTDIDVITLCDARLSNHGQLMKPERHCRHLVSTYSDYSRLWQQCLDDADTIFIIAPETDNILAQLQQQALQTGKAVLGCSPEAIRLTSNKYTCEHILTANNIATTYSCIAGEWPQHRFISESGYIVKPIDGAGCIDTFLFNSIQELEHYLSSLPIEQLQSYLVQAYVKGIAASLSVLLSHNKIEVLAINQQLISITNKLEFHGCIVNEIDSTTLSLEQAYQLASSIHHAIEGLSGFIGIDIILTPDQLVVVDINPRLTTSYTGLRASLQLNPMERFFTMQNNGSMPPSVLTHRNKVHIQL